jgi:hypothetical protein
LQRVPEYLYRILRERDGRWLVSAYLEEQQAPHTTQGPTARFTDEALPDWIRKDIALLSMVDEMGEIKSIGHRIGNAFWLVSENSKHLVKKRQVIMDMAQDKLHARFGGGMGRFFGEIKDD